MCVRTQHLAVEQAVGHVDCTSVHYTDEAAVRTITNRSEFYQRGDTSVVIQTRTVESYDASKKL